MASLAVVGKRRHHDHTATGPTGTPQGRHDLTALANDPDVARFAAALREQAAADDAARRQAAAARAEREAAAEAAARLERLRRDKDAAAERLKHVRRSGTTTEVATAEATYRDALAALVAAERGESAEAGEPSNHPVEEA